MTPAPTQFHVRIATPEDVDEVMEIGLLAHEEIAISRSNPERLLQDVWPALNRNGGIIGVIGDPGKRIEGLTMLKIETLSYGDEPFLVEKVVYVRPEYRLSNPKRAGRGRKLCEFAKEVSDSLGIPLLIGISTAVDTKQKVGMYERIFGPSIGAFFCYGRRHHSEASAPHAEENKANEEPPGRPIEPEGRPIEPPGRPIATGDQPEHTAIAAE